MADKENKLDALQSLLLNSPMASGADYAKQHPVQYSLNALAGIAAQNANPNTDIGRGLGMAGQNFMTNNLNTRRNQFLQGVQQIAQSTDDPDTKINKLVGIMAQHGTDYGFGIKDVITQYGTMGKQKTQEWKPTSQEEALNFERAKAGIKQKELSPILQKAKDTRAEAIITNIEQNNIKRDMISQAFQAAQGIQGGLAGKLQRGYLRKLDPNNPILGEWQKIKMVLTDAQLMNTAKTKGAISDREMELFSKAAANDDITSLPAMLPVFNKLIRIVNAEESGQVNSFKKLYGDNPYEWEGIKSNVDNIKLGTPTMPQSNNSDIKIKYNTLRAQGLSKEQAKRQLGL